MILQQKNEGSTLSNEHEHEVFRSISFFDLERAGFSLEVSRDPDGVYRLGKVIREGKVITKEQFLGAIFVLGMDSRRYYEIEEPVNHVTMEGKHYLGHRITAHERGDKKWLASGFASDEIKMSKCKLGGMGAHARKLANGGDR